MMKMTEHEKNRICNLIKINYSQESFDQLEEKVKQIEEDFAKIQQWIRFKDVQEMDFCFVFPTPPMFEDHIEEEQVPSSILFQQSAYLRANQIVLPKVLK